MIEEARIAGLDTTAIGTILSRHTADLADSVRPEIWERLGQMMAERPRGRS